MGLNTTIDPAILRQLRGVASKLTNDADLKKDLIQEMSIHWGHVQIKLPGRTRSWYIKSCEFHARNHLQRGRSIDSRKRAHNLVSFDLLQDESSEVGFYSDGSEDSRPALIAKDIVELITPRLTDRQNKVLQLLLDGCGIREAGRKLGISHPAVIKHRNRIALIAREVIADTRASRPELAGVSG